MLGKRVSFWEADKLGGEIQEPDIQSNCISPLEHQYENCFWHSRQRGSGSWNDYVNYHTDSVVLKKIDMSVEFQPVTVI